MMNSPTSSNQDWFLMTGDLIINLRSTKTGDASSFLSNNYKNAKHTKFNSTSSTATTATKTTTFLDDNQNQVTTTTANNKHHKSDTVLLSKCEQTTASTTATSFDGNHENLNGQHNDNNDVNCDVEDCLDGIRTSNLERQLDEAKETQIESQNVRTNLQSEPTKTDNVGTNNTGTTNTFTSSKISNSSSGNSSGIAADVDLELLSNSQSYSDCLSLSSPTKPYSAASNCSSDFHFFYDNNDKSSTTIDGPKDQNCVGDGEKPTVPHHHQQENCYENIVDMNCKYLSKSQESNLYNMIEPDSKSIDEISLDSDNSSLLYYSTSKNQRCIDTPSASRLARRLYNLEGFKKSDVARHLCKNNEFCRTVAEEYLKLFDFTNHELDDALRHFLSFFHLIGETQERERVLVYFSKRYNECNPNTEFKSVDSIHTLTCALMLLNTDLHEETIQRKMTCSNFILNLAGMNDGENYPANLLKYLYYSVKNHPLGWIDDEDDSTTSMVAKKDNHHHHHRKVFSKITTISKSINSPYATLPRKFSANNPGATAAICGSNSPSTPTTTTSFCLGNPFVEVPNPTFAIEYKKGYIRRKCCYDSNGRKTSVGKRSWKLFYATLRDLVLYLHKDENGFRKSQLQESFANSIRIHHSIASIANDYPKKKFVFRLITADYAEYLFETSDSKELQSWIDTINTTAASLSAPTLPMAVSSDNNRKFKKEIFPVSHTKLSLRDQLKDQENKLLSLQKELELLLEKSGQKSKYQKEFLEKETYLQHEIKRYRVYISCLKRELKKLTAESPPQNQQMLDNDSTTNNNRSTNDSDIDSDSSCVS